jgi:N,N'-diacetyllegionaminate synthase
MNSLPRVLVIAEIGINHDGSITKAKKLIDAAQSAGADIAKFQSYNSKDLVTEDAPIASYQRDKQDKQLTQQVLLARYEISVSGHHELFAHCNEKNIEFLSTAFDEKSYALLEEFNLLRVKVPSGEITNLPFLRKVGGSGSEILLSTGMSTLTEVENAIVAMENAGAKRSQFVVMHCSSSYPAPHDEVNLLAMQKMGEIFGTRFGYSDHTQGIEVALAAVALGASVIEKHLTLDRNSIGPDHLASIEPNEFLNMVKSIRNIEVALGSDEKSPSFSEEQTKKVVRKSIVAKKSINKGEIFSVENITCKRPGTGISPMNWDNIIGQVAHRNYAENDLID